MKKTLIAVSMTFLVINPALAQKASPVQPAPGEQVCFQRTYSQEHLQQHPEQRLSSLYVEMDHFNWEASDGEVISTPTTKVTGVSAENGEYYINNDASCDYRSDGSTHCGVECDGGAFVLSPKKSGVMFSVDQNYYFPLFRDGTSQETAEDGDTISLLADDAENRAYLLKQVPVSECKAAQERAKIGNWGC